jgi:hypothetical protein
LQYSAGSRLSPESGIHVIPTEDLWRMRLDAYSIGVRREGAFTPEPETAQPFDGAPPG